MPQLERSSPAWRMRRNVRWNLLGNVVYALGQWLQLIILARMGGPAAVGRYAFALALTGPVMMFASLCLRFLQASDARGAYAFREYLCLRRGTTVAAVFAIAIIASTAGVGRAVWLVLLPVCSMRAADALSDIYYGLWQQHERMNVISWGLVLNAVSSVAFMTAASRLGGGVPGAAVGAALGSCVSLVFIHLRTVSDRELRRAIAPSPEPVAWRRLFRLSAEAAPLGLTILLGSLQQNIPRFFVQRYAGAVALGLFAAASQLTTAGDLLAGALGAAAIPRLGSFCTRGDTRSFRNLTRKLVLAGALLGAAGVTLSAVGGRWFLVHLYRPEFGSGAHLLVILSIAAGMWFVASLLGYALSSARVITVQPILLTVTLTMLLLCCATFVPRYGVEGAAWALLAASSLHALVSWAALHRFRVEASGVQAPQGTQKSGAVHLPSIDADVGEVGNSVTESC